MKKTNQMFMIVLVIVLLSISVLLYFTIFNIHTPAQVNLADIEDMNIGTDVPKLLYGDGNYIVIDGTFGIIVYNIKDQVVTDRISYEQTKSQGISFPLSAVSLDGSVIYYGEVKPRNEFVYTHQYHIKKNKFNEVTKQPTKLFQPIIIESPGYNKDYDRYFDLDHYLNGYYIVNINDSFLYLRAEHNWRMKTLQLVSCDYEDGSNKVYDIFK